MSETAWKWIDGRVIEAVHEEQLVEHGGLPGIRDPRLLASALARPLNLQAYGQPPPDVADLAAAYAHGLAKNHPFVDGNKRTAFVALELFLSLNGWRLVASDADCVLVMLQLAGGELTEGNLASWIRTQALRI